MKHRKTSEVLRERAANARRMAMSFPCPGWGVGESGARWWYQQALFRAAITLCDAARIMEASGD